MRVLLWFHRDLRTHDHEGLSWALREGCELTGVCVAPASAGEAKRRFWQECTEELSRHLAAAGIELRVCAGPASEAITPLARETGAELLLTHRRTNQRDERELETVLRQTRLECKLLGEPTLYALANSHAITLDDLKPFSKFKAIASKYWTPASPQLRHPKLRFEARPVAQWFTGGESAGLARVHDYLRGTRRVHGYHETRNGMLERDDSSKFSPWLAWGALSVRQVYQELLQTEQEQGPSEGIDALIYELVWRDYFKFLALFTKDKLFSQQGLRSKPRSFAVDQGAFRRWCVGETGEPFVDANMRELAETGWMSNRGRQNVASYLAKTMGLDWVSGARYFEEQLVDDDTENNWGNWQYLAGVGTDPRDRVFNPRLQAERYDQDGAYRARWLKKDPRA